ncbi:hypothetical protein LMH87_007023 [Akanthomyces muscarius]|uniref:Uncharacterized protein n=1 Tax=Akanthomyces muscarius TaxID=2231603 RepID=A0A9W8QPF1_AKAMU|nr:hypothetical protein LMH87_007023 [Akanthomyces muscarius]KAJ4165389.1 hypothetical protein LMH87_007023 [Akanthomyces muscarius]
MATIIQPPSTSPRPQVLAALAIPSVDHFIITSVFSSSLNGEIHLLNSHSGAVVQTIKAHNAGVRCPEFLDDRTVISGSKDGSLRVCELSNDSLERQKILTGHTAEENAYMFCRVTHLVVIL